VRLAVFTLVEWSFTTVRDWAVAAGHEVTILVTQPAVPPSPGLQHALADPATTVLVVPKVVDCAAAVGALDVDLAVVFNFLRVPESVAELPRHGIVNLHPSMLPAYRGANGYRSLYQGEPRIGVTLHYLTPEFDAGPILAQSSEPTPQDPQPMDALDALKRTATTALQIGVPKALAGESGEPQDDGAATAAPKFTEQEAVLDPTTLGTHLFQCRFSALMLAGIQPSVLLADGTEPVRAVRRLHGLSAVAPGTIEMSSRRAIVAVADGVLQLDLGKLPF
jgi:methionyl-tRNA formyltransferase